MIPSYLTSSKAPPSGVECISTLIDCAPLALLRGLVARDRAPPDAAIAGCCYCCGRAVPMQLTRGLRRTRRRRTYGRTSCCASKNGWFRTGTLPSIISRHSASYVIRDVILAHDCAPAAMRSRRMKAEKRFFVAAAAAAAASSSDPSSAVPSVTRPRVCCHLASVLTIERCRPVNQAMWLTSSAAALASADGWIRPVCTCTTTALRREVLARRCRANVFCPFPRGVAALFCYITWQVNGCVLRGRLRPRCTARVLSVVSDRSFSRFVACVAWNDRSCKERK